VFAAFLIFRDLTRIYRMYRIGFGDYYSISCPSV
jgi:hypothetical protein